MERDEEEDRRNRFGHLLKPIRDLAENFNIDLAHELEDYLDDLETITISFNDTDQGIKKLNFAEAALLIRGSSLIYSKKVDYLYDLVFKVLDSVTAQRDKRIRVDLHEDNDGSDNNGTTNGATSTADFVQAFLSLDDIPEADNISLGGQEYESTTHARAEWDVDARRSNAVNFAVPLAFLQAANIHSTNSNNFKLSTSHVHASGALLLNPSSSMQYHHLSDNTTAMCLSSGLLGGPPNTTHGCHHSAKSPGMQDAAQNAAAAAAAAYDDYGDDFGGDGGGMDEYGGDGGFDEADYSHVSHGAGSPSVSQRLFSQPEDGMDGMDGIDNNRASDPGHCAAVSVPPVDHWIFHEPHDQAHRGKKAFRMGKYKLCRVHSACFFLVV